MLVRDGVGCSKNGTCRGNAHDEIVVTTETFALRPTEPCFWYEKGELLPERRTPLSHCIASDRSLATHRIDQLKAYLA